MLEQILGDGLGVLLLAVHAQGQGLDAAAHRVAFGRSQNAAETVLREVDAAFQILAGGDHEARDHVGVAGQVLGGGVDDHVRAEVERLLEIRGHESVVHDHQSAVFVGDGGDAAHIVDLQQRVGDGLEVDGLCGGGVAVAADGAFETVEVAGRVHGGDLKTPTGEVVVQLRVAAAVDVVAGHDAVAGLEDGEHGVDGGQAGGEGEAAATVFELRDLVLQEVTGRIAAARVIPARHGVDRGEGVRRRVVDRRVHGSSVVVVDRQTMNELRVEPCHNCPLISRLKRGGGTAGGLGRRPVRHGYDHNAKAHRLPRRCYMGWLWMGIRAETLYPGCPSPCPDSGTLYSYCSHLFRRIRTGRHRMSAPARQWQCYWIRRTPPRSTG